MNYITYILLGFIQGITEPLPISSSGHVFLFKNIFNTNIFNNLDFEIISNFGSFLGIFIIFRKDIIILMNHFIKYIFSKDIKYKDNYNYILKIIISTIPVVITGLLFNNYLEGKYSIKILIFTFLFTSLLLYLVRNKNGYKNIISFKDSIIIGLFQSITIIPGISRSGTVLVACLLCNIKKEEALKYTFMLYFPVSIGAFLLKIKDLSLIGNNLLLPYIIGMLTSLIITYLSYKWLSNIVKKNNLWKFSIYALLMALFIIYYFR